MRARQGAHGAEVDGLRRIVVLEFPAWIAGQGRMAAPVDETEHVVPDHLPAEPDAARAKDASLVVERHPRSEGRVLRLHILRLDVARVPASVAGRLLLELALARLVADRAVQRVVDQEKLHHALAAF